MEEKMEEKMEEITGEENSFGLTDEEEKILKLLGKGFSTVTEISEKLDIPKEKVLDPLLDEVRSSIYRKTGYIIELERKTRKVFLRRATIPTRILKLPKIASKTVKILFTSDWGLGLKTQQGDLLATSFKEPEKEDPEVWFSVVAGNLCAGRPKTKKDIDDHFLFSYEEQLDYLARHFPKTSFKHYILNSWRELSFNRPETIGESLAKTRDDIRCYGNHQASFLVGDTTITVSHLESDFSAYTLSHGLQIAMENYQDATEYIYLPENRPQILLMGGINADFEIPPKLPLKKERKNNFYAQTIPSLHPATSRQLSKRGRRAIPFSLGYLILTLEFDEKGHLIGEPKFDARNLTPYIRNDNYLTDVKFSENLDEEEKKIIGSLNQQAYTMGGLSNILGKSIPHAQGVVERLQKKGYKIIWFDAEKRFKLEKPLKEKFEPIGIISKKSAKIAVISDTHIGHKNERPDLLKEAYRIAEEKKVDRIFHCGDVFDGADAHPFHNWDLLFSLADEQRNHGLEVWPKSKIRTDMIRGSTGHETVFLNMGHDIVDAFCRLAPHHKLKLKYLGSMNEVSSVNKINFQLLHLRGGIPRGISYRPQRLAEETVSVIEKYSAEKVLLTGHLHVASAMLHKGVFLLMAACMEDTTDYLKASGHISWLGMWICEIFMDKYNNIIRTVREYVPFLPKDKELKEKKK